ncbi:MAG: CDGSH iron-sulfur domain-containing protein [Bacteroidota bacterium]
METSNARFKVIAGGPLEITGHFRVVNTMGRIIEKEGPVFLCRCGGSSNKPYCDGSHKRNGFSK